ncbi:hypothetical protein BaRGS_00039195 [Batillaria attramentaria]|uniref:Uncharacterized protein n=1 Tax=Batillaria attramentaria TaxID=370345 RepID=A0ABD0J3Z2_9CAEN
MMISAVTARTARRQGDAHLALTLNTGHTRLHAIPGRRQEPLSGTHGAMTYAAHHAKTKHAEHRANWEHAKHRAKEHATYRAKEHATYLAKERIKINFLIMAPKTPLRRPS